MGLLLQLFVFCCALPAVSAGGAGTQWWCDDHQCYHEDYAYVEAIIIIMLVALAVIFDTAHHRLAHIADHSYFYGKLQFVAPDIDGPDQDSCTRHMLKQQTPLFKHWVNRLSMEFMVLGFLAFFVFVFREAGGFEWVVHTFPSEESHTHLPRTAEDWLHMVENVHMKLFLGMIVYFLLILKVVNGCVRHVALWEEMRILRLMGRVAELPDKTVSDALDQTGLHKYCRWRLYFMQSVMTWRNTRPELYDETLKRLGIWSCDTPSQRRFQRSLDEGFPFSAYLAYSVRACCKDTVDIHPVTWAAVIVLFTIFAFIHRYAKLILLHFMPVFIIGAFLLLFCVWRLNRVFSEHVESAGSRAVKVAAGADDAQNERTLSLDLESADGAIDAKRFDSPAVRRQRTQGFHERHSTELWVFRMLQVCLFVLSFFLARTVGDANEWRNRPKEVLAISSAFTVLFIVLGSLLPKYVPNFAALMAMPPYCDQSNVDTFFEVLEEYKTQHAQLCFHERQQDKSADVVYPSLLKKRSDRDAFRAVKVEATAPAVKNGSVRFEVEPDSSEAETSESLSHHGSAASLRCEMGMMRTHLARLESLMLMQSRQAPCPPPLPIEELAPLEVASDTGGSPLRQEVQIGPSLAECSGLQHLRLHAVPDSDDSPLAMQVNPTSDTS